MAKAKRAKYVSKGQRRNSRIHKKHERAVVGNLNNAMREAMGNAQVSASVVGSSLASICINALMKPVKLTQEQQRGWSAHLSFKTYQQLKEQGILQ